MLKDATKILNLGLNHIVEIAKYFINLEICLNFVNYKIINFNQINKKMRKTLIPFVILCTLLLNGFLLAGEKTVEISLPTIQCGTCVKTIGKALNKLEGFTNIDIDIENHKATVTFDDTKTDLSKIEDAISGAGYDANDKKADQTAYSNLHACCKLPKDR